MTLNDSEPNKTVSRSFNYSLKPDKGSIHLDQAVHYNLAFKKIESMFQDGKLCDVSLLCNNGTVEIKAHRVILSSISDYFCAMFTNNLAESFKNEIEINDIDGESLKILVDYIYTGKIELNDANIFAILNASNFLQLENVVTLGCDFLCKNLNISNCVSIYRFSEQQSLSKLKEISYKFLLDNFEKLAFNTEFLNELEADELEQLFHDEYLNISTEEIVYESLFRWVEMNKEERKKSLGRLLANVKLPLLKANFLATQIENNEFFANNCKCQSLMLEAMAYHLIPEKYITTPNMRTTPRKSTVGNLFFYFFLV